MSKRIWNESTLIWDRAGAELWNLAARAGRFIAGGDGDGDADFLDFQEEQEKLRSPAIMLEDFNPNLSESKKRLLEIAGVARNFFSRKDHKRDVSIFITEATLRSK